MTRKLGPNDSLWYKDAVIYELPIRAYSDGNDDGIGDLRGLESKLDYLHDLGVSTIWLLPFYPSPKRDGGYDISNYTDIDPAYGTREDFARLLRGAHARGLRVITELILNHTSNEHAWFQRARRAPPGSAERDFYVWSDTPERYQDTRIIFSDFESSNWSWDPLAHAYFWHRFYSHQPDLNFDNPAVHDALFRVVDFWLEMGVDGMRLDAVPYLYEREGTNCENLPETHVFLKKLRAHIDGRFEQRVLLAEANQWPIDAAAYFADGDECHMNFHFPLMPRMFMAVELEDNFPIVNILGQTPQIPENCQWATFLRNHDELTLEMVTDEDRDYMVRVYAEERTARINLGIRRRLAPLMRTRRRIELMNGLLFSLPGTPVLYYGDEIGMGDNIYLGDRDGVRTPMQWNSDRNAGFSKCNPQKLYLPVIIDPEHHYEAVNVEAQQNNPQSLLWWMKRIIALRKQHRVFGRGTIEFLHPDNHRMLAFVRAYRDERVLVVANLSRHVQFTNLDLSRLAGFEPLELFGKSRFPIIEDKPYPFTLGPHDFYWFALKPSIPVPVAEHARLPMLHAEGSLSSLVRTLEGRKALEPVLVDYLTERSYFRGERRPRSGATILDAVPMGYPDAPLAWLLLVRIDFDAGPPETYVLPIAFQAGPRSREIETREAHAVIAAVRIFPTGNVVPDGEGFVEGILIDALTEPDVRAALLGHVRDSVLFSGTRGLLGFMRFPFLESVAFDVAERSRLHSLGPANTTVVYGEALGLQVFRNVEEGIYPEYELRHFLAEQSFPHVPRLAGAIAYDVPGRERIVVGMLEEWIAHQGDGLDLTRESLDLFFERVLAEEDARGACPPMPTGLLTERARSSPPPLIHDLFGAYFLWLQKLGKRTAELHLALAVNTPNPAFGREAFSVHHQQSLYQYVHAMLLRSFDTLRRQARRFSDAARLRANSLLSREQEIDARLLSIVSRKLDVVRIRCHGDLHLGQVLFTGEDFMFIHFEGEPARPLFERRYRRSALRDVAGMLRSLDYAVYLGLGSGRVRPEDVPVLEPWSHAWVAWAEAIYLQSYLEAARGSAFLPVHDADIDLLLDFYLLEKCIYEIGHELRTRPDWVDIPLRGLERLAAGWK